MFTKKEKEIETEAKKGTNKNILIILLALSIFLNIYLFQKTNVVSKEPTGSNKMYAKYQELLGTESEEEAQKDLIDWLKQNPLVISAEQVTEKGLPGVTYDYCTGGRAGGHNSFESLKTMTSK